MANIRELFHNIGNKHNSMSVSAGVTKVELERKFGGKAPVYVKETIKRLSEFERNAVEASKELRKLKDIIYAIIDPDTGKPKK